MISYTHVTNTSPTTSKAFLKVHRTMRTHIHTFTSTEARHDTVNAIVLGGPVRGEYTWRRGGTCLVSEGVLPYWHLQHEILLAEAKAQVGDGALEEAGGPQHQHQVEVPGEGSLGGREEDPVVKTPKGFGLIHSPITSVIAPLSNRSNSYALCYLRAHICTFK